MIVLIERVGATHLKYWTISFGQDQGRRSSAFSALACRPHARHLLPNYMNVNGLLRLLLGLTLYAAH